MSVVAVNKMAQADALLLIEYLMKQSDDKETRYEISAYESKDKLTHEKT